MGLKYKAIVPIPSEFWEPEAKIYDGGLDRMMTKKEVCEAFGVSATNPERFKIFNKLNEHSNIANKHAIYKASELQDLLNNLEIDRSKN